MNFRSLKFKIQKLPKTPGVYVFYDKNKNVLYVGKAGSLQVRVRSYFSGRNNNDTNFGPVCKYANRPIEIMIHEVADIKVHKTETVLEALILESHLIKKLQPKYNAIGKDDKSFCYFVITREEYPRVLILRKTNLTKNPKSEILNPKQIQNSKFKIQSLFGPYTSKKQMEIALKIIRKIFPFHSSNQKTEKGCIDFELGRCPGPYAGAITRSDYMKNIRGIQMILKGKKKSLIRKLENEMKKYAEKNEFEKAAETRNKIFALKHIQDVALTVSGDIHQSNLKVPKVRIFRIEAYDISNISGQYATGSMVVFKNHSAEKSQYRKFKIKTIDGSNDIGMMREVLLRRFRNDWPKPDLILLDGGVGHLHMAEKVLQKLKLEIPIIAVAKGPSRKISDYKFLISKKFPIIERGNLKNIISGRNMISQIMAEAHRFAIGYHRKLRRSSQYMF